MFKITKPKFTSKIGWYHRIFGYYLYFCDKEDKLKYITKFSRTITSEIIDDYRKEMGKLTRECQKQCIITMKSELSRFDASLSNNVTTGATFIAIIFSLYIVYIQSIFEKSQQFATALPWIFCLLLILAGVGLWNIISDIRINAYKRAHLTVILLILEEKDNQNTCSGFSRDIWAEISHIGHLRDKGYVTEDEFQTKKTELLSR